jgi:hypothetical protein
MQHLLKLKLVLPIYINQEDMGNRCDKVKYSERYMQIDKLLNVYLPEVISPIVIGYMKCIRKLTNTNKFIENKYPTEHGVQYVKGEYISVYGGELYIIYGDVISVYNKDTLDYLRMYDRTRVSEEYLNQINGMSVAEDGIYISNGDINCIDVLDRKSGKTMRTIGKGILSDPHGTLIHCENIFVVDYKDPPADGHAIIRVFNRYTGDRAYDINTGIHGPSKMVVNGNKLYVSNVDKGGHYSLYERSYSEYPDQGIHTYDINTSKQISKIGQFGKLTNEKSTVNFYNPYGLAMVDSELIVADVMNSRICVMDPDSGKLITSVGNSKDSSDFSTFRYPFDIVVDGDNLYVSSQDKVSIFDIH